MCADINRPATKPQGPTAAERVADRAERGEHIDDGRFGMTVIEGWEPRTLRISMSPDTLLDLVAAEVCVGIKSRSNWRWQRDLEAIRQQTVAELREIINVADPQPEQPDYRAVLLATLDGLRTLRGMIDQRAEAAAMTSHSCADAFAETSRELGSILCGARLCLAGDPAAAEAIADAILFGPRANAILAAVGAAAVGALDVAQEDWTETLDNDCNKLLVEESPAELDALIAQASAPRLVELHSAAGAPFSVAPAAVTELYVEAEETYVVARNEHRVRESYAEVRALLGLDPAQEEAGADGC